MQTKDLNQALSDPPLGNGLKEKKPCNKRFFFRTLPNWIEEKIRGHSFPI